MKKLESNEQGKPIIIAIVGPTATGKSALAVALAKKIGGEIISADSRQVYRGLDLGTGKITKQEMKGVPHHLLDVVEPKQQYGAARYRMEARRALYNITRRKKLPIIVGGTGFYLSALLGESTLADVPPNTALRKKLAKLPTEKLFEMLKQLDRKRAAVIDKKNPRRLIRAIEIAIYNKNKKKAARQASPAARLPYRVIKIGLDLPDDILKSKIESRLDARLEKGLIAEARRLHAQGLSWKRMSEVGIEYAALAKFLQKKISQAEMKQGILIKSWHYAKRQRTWWKRDKNIVWFKPSENKKIIDLVKKFSPR